MARKINTAAIKEFMFQHGEKVALGTCAFLALLFGGMGLLGAMSAGKPAGSSKPWVQEFKDQQTRIATGLATAPALVLSDGVKAKMDEIYYDWKKIDSKYQQVPYTIQGEPTAFGRVNPRVLPIEKFWVKKDENKKDEKPISLIHAEVVKGLVYAYDVNEAERFVRGAVKKAPPPVKGTKSYPEDLDPKTGKPFPPQREGLPMVRKGLPTRMVVVTAVFPMKKQVEEFRKALRISNQKDYFELAREDLPHPLGINVIKFEIVNGKKVNDQGEVLIEVNWQTKEKKVAPNLNDLLHIAMFDDGTPKLLKDHIWYGLNTPWPKLANAQYPRFNFDGFNIAWPERVVTPKREPEEEKKKTDLPIGNPRDKEKAIDNPRQKVGEELEVIEFKEKVLRAKMPALADRLFGAEGKGSDYKYDLFHVHAATPAPVEKPAPKDSDPPVKPPVTVPVKGSELYNSAWDYNLPKDNSTWDHDALVRFIDPGVVPGKTYQYAIQVRMANPNFGKDASLLAFADLARYEELQPSPWVETEEVTVPREYYLYAIDQKHLDDSARIPDPKKVAPKDPPPHKDSTPFQVHQWKDVAQNAEGNGPAWVIGDWVVAESVWVRKGEPIGSQVPVEVPVWQKLRDGFLIPAEIDNPKKKGEKLPGFKIDLNPVPGSELPILVDFVGARKMKENNKVDEDPAVDALILTPDGKLTVVNSRKSADPESFEGYGRQERVNRARFQARFYRPIPTRPDPKGGRDRPPGVPDK